MPVRVVTRELTAQELIEEFFPQAPQGALRVDETTQSAGWVEPSGSVRAFVPTRAGFEERVYARGTFVPRFLR